MSRPLGGYIGYDAEPATTAAPGIWTLREAEFYQRKAQWPTVFAPSDITGLQAWYDASDASTLYDATTGGSLVAADGGVARWEDKSGNDYHMTQATAGSRPARKTAIQAGLDVLRFDGSDDVLVASGTSSTITNLTGGQATLLAVFSTASANPDALQTIVSNGFSSAGDIGFNLFHADRVSASESDDIRVRVVNTGSGNNVIYDCTNTGPNLTAGQFGVVSVVTDMANGTANDRATIRVNGGAAAGTDSGSTASASSSPSYDLHLGQAAGNSFNLDGDICEIIIYNSALSDTDREAVEDYLIAKWGIS